MFGARLQPVGALQQIAGWRLERRERTDGAFSLQRSGAQVDVRVEERRAEAGKVATAAAAETRRIGGRRRRMRVVERLRIVAHSGAAVTVWMRAEVEVAERRQQAARRHYRVEGDWVVGAGCARRS